MIRWITVLCLTTVPVWATQDGWPALFDVQNVASDDVLNVRDAPDVSGEIIGTLAPEAQDIEVIRPNPDLTWGLVNVGDVSGWVSLAFLARRPGQWDGQIPAIRACFGTEPFWSVNIEGPAMLFSTPETDGNAGLISARVAASGRRDRFVVLARLLSGDAAARDVAIHLRTEACNDGMSDRSYGIATDMLVINPDDPNQSVLYAGCCSLVPPL